MSGGAHLLDEAAEIARLAKDAGGRAFIVGGAVRDMMGGVAPKDVDIEVFGIGPDRLQKLLESRYALNLVGKSFGVIKLSGIDIDVAIPRRESKSGQGHRAFAIEGDPGLTVKEAASRRDFTVNAVYLDPLTGEYDDPWGGRADFRNRILRHVSDKFSEDPLRVLRGMQFVARFNLDAAPETVAVCRGMTPEGLASERLFEEWSKLLLKGVEIGKGLRFLRDTGWVRYYPELERLIGCEPAPEWHPEGDVWNHTCCCLDAFARRRDMLRAEGKTDPHEDLVVGLAVLCHDFGKPATSRWDPVKRRIRSLGHDEEGVAPTLSFLRRLTNDESILREVPPLVQMHMKPFALWSSHAGDAAIRRLAAKVKRIDRLVRVARADDEGRPPYPSEPESLDWLAAQAERLRVADSAPKPIVRGRDLLAHGVKPGPEMGRMLERCYEAQLDGRFSDLAGGLAFIGL